MAMKNKEVVAAGNRGYTSKDEERAIEKANDHLKAKNDDPRLRCTIFYMIQSLQTLGSERDRVSVPIYIHSSVHRNWYTHLDNAIAVINQAAPGLNLNKVDNSDRAKVKIYGTDQNKAYTKGDILLGSSCEIHLYHRWWNMKRSSVHELLHALGFQHEQKRWDSHFSITVKTSNAQYTPSTDIFGVERFDPFSIMLYSESSELVRKTEGDTMWQLKPSKDINNVMSEIDKVGVNLIYKPCKGPNYNPRKSSVTGMWYCGRKVMERHNYPAESTTDGYCGPNNWANCHACRTLQNDKVKKLWDVHKWQGGSGLVYCGKYFGVVEEGHDGYCGPNNGPPCRECRKILSP